MTKEKYSSIPKDELKASSTTFMLQELKKEATKKVGVKEAASVLAIVRCPVCFQEIAPNPRCFGHGGGGAGNTDEEKASEKKDESLKKLGQLIENSKKLINDFSPMREDEHDFESLLDEKTFALEIIAVADGILEKPQDFALNPLPMQPKSSNKDKLSRREEIEHPEDVESKKMQDKEEGIFSPSPFNMKPF